VGPRAGQDRCGKSRLHRDLIPERPARSSVPIPTEPPGPQPAIYAFQNLSLIVIAASKEIYCFCNTFLRRLNRNFCKHKFANNVCVCGGWGSKFDHGF
jgi:hypothetical protein